MNNKNGISDKAYENDISTLITIEISYEKFYISNMSTLFKQNPPNQFLEKKKEKKHHDCSPINILKFQRQPHIHQLESTISKSLRDSSGQ